MNEQFVEMSPLVLAVATSGALGGLLAGLLGVGGGIIIVPVLFTAIEATGIESNIAIKVAVGTSLATIVPTAVSSARSHFRHDAIDIQLVKGWCLPVAVGVALGTSLAGLADGKLLAVTFGSIAALVALDMLLRREGRPILSSFPEGPAKAGSGVLIGFFSSLMGIGGGTLSVPILTAVGFDIRRAIGTSAAVGLLISIPGTFGYILNGLSVQGRPPGSVGNVNVIAFVILVPLTTLFAPIGAKLAHAISRHLLQRCFALFLLVTAIRMFSGVL